MSVLKDRYEKEIKQSMLKDMNLNSIMAVPKIEKIIINMGISMAVSDKKYVDSAVEELTQIAGQRAIITRAKKSIANFKLRQGMPIGCRVTLRGERMYEFLDRFFNVALPRVRDFRGINPDSFDGRGNYNMGLKEQLIFPEIDYDKIDKVRGMDICFVTTATTDEEARELLKLMGAEIYLYVNINGTPITARVEPTSTAKPGDEIEISFDLSKIHIFDKDTEKTITN